MSYYAIVDIDGSDFIVIARDMARRERIKCRVKARCRKDAVSAVADRDTVVTSCIEA